MLRPYRPVEEIRESRGLLRRLVRGLTVGAFAWLTLGLPLAAQFFLPAG